MADLMRRRIQIRLIILLEHASRANIVRGGFQTLSIIPQSHGGRVNRAIFIDDEGGAQPRRHLSVADSRPGRVAIFPVFHDPKISSRSHGKIEKLTPLLAGGYPNAVDAHRSFGSYLLDFLYTTRHGDSAPCFDSDEYSLEEFITSIYARVSNSYPGRSTGRIEPTDVYPSSLSRIPTGLNSFLRLSPTM